jgi:hypothetical protein
MAARILEIDHPKAFDILQKQLLTFNYRNDGRYMHYFRPLIEKGANEGLVVNYSPQFLGFGLANLIHYIAPQSLQTLLSTSIMLLTSYSKRLSIGLK